MISRIRKSMQEKDQGFTLIELLVVIIIIGILAAIAIPLFLNQRKKAVDTAARSDASTLGKEIAAYWVDGTGVDLAITETDGGRYSMNADDLTAAVDLGNVSNNIEFGDLTGSSNMNWCVYVKIDEDTGTLTSVEYSAKDGLVSNGECATE